MTMSDWLDRVAFTIVAALLFVVAAFAVSIMVEVTRAYPSVALVFLAALVCLWAVRRVVTRDERRHPC